MANLHLISQAQTLETFKLQLGRFINANDSLLFIADATINLCDSDFISIIQRQLKQHQAYALTNDCLSRGIASNIEQLIMQSDSDNIKFIDDQTMVNLTLQHQQIISW